MPEAPQIIRRAHRNQNGRVLEGRPGQIRQVSPPVLLPLVVKVLTVKEQVQVQGLRMRQAEMNKQMKALLASFGLNPNRGYRFTPSGEVIDTTRRTAVYD